MAGRCACNQVCNCCSQSSPSIDVSGTGVVGACFVPQVNYSEQGKNRAQPGSDGGLYVGPQCLYDSRGQAITSGADGCVTLPAPAILNYNGVLISPDSQGRIPLPTGGLPPNFGDGLTSAPDGSLIAAVSGTFPTVDADGTTLGGADTDGAQIYVDAAGDLRAPAEHTSLSVTGGNDVWPASLHPVPDLFTTAASDPVVLVNPSPSRQMTVGRYVYAVVDLITPPDAGCNVSLQADFGSGMVPLRVLTWPQPLGGTASVRYWGQVTYFQSTILAPGDSLITTMQVEFHKVGVGTADPVLVSARCIATLFGVTR